MKVGITLNDYYKKYLGEIASLNNMSITSICGLIVENFLSYNEKNKKFPLFKTSISIVFAQKVNKTNQAENEVKTNMTWDEIQEHFADEEESSLSREEILASLCDNED